MNAREKSFSIKEARERELLTLLYNHFNKDRENKFEVMLEVEKYFPYDATIYSKGKPHHVVEVKVRENYSYTQIEKWGGSFLEEKKLLGIIDKQKELGIDVPIFYINFYKDQVVVYKLDKQLSNYKWITQNLQADDFGGREIEKKVTKLDPSIIVYQRNRKTNGN